MAVITTGSIPLALWPGQHALWGTTYNEHPKTYPMMFEKTTSDKAYEEYLPFTGFGLAQVKPQGSSMAFDGQQQGQPTRLTNVTYALGYIVTMEEIQDNQYKVVSETRTRANAFSMLQAKEQNGNLIYNRAFNSTYVGADGQPLCSTAHVNVSGGTFANTFATPADLSESSLEDAVISIAGLADDKGLLIGVKPKSLVVPRQQMFTAERILKSVYQPGTANNDINALRETNSIPDGVTMSVYLTAPNAWFVRTDCGGNVENGMIYQERMAPEFMKDNEFTTKNMMAGCVERYAFGWADPRGIWGSNGP
jgi:hypothetical protein